MLDLSLARTYVPLCLCFAKSLGVWVFCTTLRAAGTPPASVFVAAAAALFAERAAHNEYIFDTNAIASFVLFALAVDATRVADALDSASERRLPVALALNVVWAAAGIAALLRVHERVAFFRYVPFRPLPFGAVCLVLHSFLRHGPEHETWMMLRVFNFSALSVVWIYCVNLQGVCAARVYDCVDCCVFFGSVLFSEPPTAVLATVAAAAVLLHQRPRPPPESDSDTEAAVCSPPEPDSDLSLLQQARAAMDARHRM
jgi:hypothetical protein